jgi:hypothetical protein
MIEKEAQNIVQVGASFAYFRQDPAEGKDERLMPNKLRAFRLDPHEKAQTIQWRSMSDRGRKMQFVGLTRSAKFGGSEIHGSERR